MKNISVRQLLLSVAIFAVGGFLVHLIFNPEPTIWGSVGYGVLFGLIAGVGFYFVDRKKR